MTQSSWFHSSLKRSLIAWKQKQIKQAAGGSLYLFLYSRMQKSKRKNFSKIRMKAPLQLLTAVVRLRNSRRDEEKRSKTVAKKAAAYRKETVREIQDPWSGKVWGGTSGKVEAMMMT